MTFEGVIVQESLKEPKILEKVTVHNVREEGDWHIYRVTVSPEQFVDLTMLIKQGWYMHFWQGKNVIVVFPGRMFKFNHDDKESWIPAIRYGCAMGIPEEQLDFPIE